MTRNATNPRALALRHLRKKPPKPENYIVDYGDEVDTEGTLCWAWQVLEYDADMKIGAVLALMWLLEPIDAEDHEYDSYSGFNSEGKWVIQIGKINP